VIHTITDPDTGEYLRVNEAFFKIMGWTQAETIGHTAVELNIWRDVSNREAIMRALTMGDGSVRDYQVDFQTKASQSRTMLVDMEEVELPEGKRLFLSAVDITDREIIEKQLRQSQKMEAVGQLTGGIAHDFNNLLGVIIGHAELLSQNLSNKDQLQSSADAIMRAADNGSELIKNLLGFSRQASTHATPTNILNRIDDLISLLSTTLGKDIELKVSNRAAHSISNLDPAQLDSAIINLAINARDAMPNGGTLTITISNELIKPNNHIDLRPGNYINLATEDNGIGMSEAVASRAFEPFFTSREFGNGTGLGLSMVFGFAKQSNGTASIKSKPGEGTTVQLLLPVTKDAESVALTDGQIQKQDFNAQQVLLVEDNPDIRDIVTLLLQSLNFEVTTEESGDLALSHIDRQFDLIVSDVMLPGTKKGPDVVRAFREKYQQLPALYMSGYQPGVLSAGELEHPNVEYIQKPFTRQQFNKKISLIKAK
jgi:PAS domain S-box-containing protein